MGLEASGPPMGRFDCQEFGWNSAIPSQAQFYLGLDSVVEMI